MRALREMLKDGETGVFLETAHPAKFSGTVESAIGSEVIIPDKLKAFMAGEKQTVEISKDFCDLKNYLMTK
jgi:threonine synthase